MLTVKRPSDNVKGIVPSPKIDESDRLNLEESKRV